MLYDLGMKVSLATLLTNLGLAIYKLSTGFFGNSASMFADGVHTLSDVATTLVVMVSLYISKQPADKEHPYGHGRAESIAAKTLGLVLIAVAFSILKTGLQSLTSKSTAPSPTALYAAIVSIGIKEAMYQVTARAGRKQNSQALIADAWHHRSDAFSSIGTLIGISAAQKGFYFMDGLGALMVAVLIINMGLSIWKKTVDELMDTQKDESVREMIVSICMNQGIILNENLLRLRHYGKTVYADMTISIQANTTVADSHKLAELVRLNLISNISCLEDILIHIDPLDLQEPEWCTSHESLNRSV